MAGWERYIYEWTPLSGDSRTVQKPSHDLSRTSRRAALLWVWFLLLALFAEEVRAEDGVPPAAPTTATPPSTTPPPPTPTQNPTPPAPPEAPPALPTLVRVTPLEVVRGSRVVVVASGLPKDRKNIRILLDAIDIGAPTEFDKEGVAFIVPESGEAKLPRIPFGSLRVRVQVRHGETWSVPLAPADVPSSTIHVGRDAKPGEIKLIRAEPGFVPFNGSQLLVVGEGMGGNVEDYVLLLNDREVRLCNRECEGGLVARFTSPRQLQIDGPFPKTWEGSRTLSVRAGDVDAQAALTVRFMPMDVRSVKWWAALWSSALIAALLGLAMFGSGTYNIDPRELLERPVKRLGVFLLDRNTDTYSLSLFQIYLWTAAAVFGYVFLTISRVLCQGVLEIADVPENLPGILAVSTTTVVASAGIASQKGPKGAGDAHPSIKDLISTGGIVQPERCVYLLWTLVAVGAFLLAIVKADPTSLKALPGIPEQMLWLSGVGAAGYLGGKLARRAGPVIDDIKVGADKLQLTVVGRGLDPQASFEINGTPLEKLLSQNPAEATRALKPPGAKEEATELWLKLTPDPAWLASPKVDFTIINRDGQRATWPFTYNPTPLVTP
jgi:hypothetical protein